MTVAAAVEAAAVGGSGAQRGSLAGETGAAGAAAAVAAAAAEGSSLAGSLPLAPTPAWHTQQTGQRGDRLARWADQTCLVLQNGRLPLGSIHLCGRNTRAQGTWHRVFNKHLPND